jgi:hypothetical protein
MDDGDKGAIKRRGSDDEFLEMSKWFITTTRRFTEEIKVKS